MSLDLAKQRLNYDLIAHLYDEPLRDYQTDQHLIARLAEEPDRPLTDWRILDVGCGTGKQQTANQAAYPLLNCLGVDLFAGMLRQAQRRGPEVTWIQADAANLPLRPSSFDYVSNQFSYPHIQDKKGFVHGVYDVLRENGQFVMTNIDPWLMPNWLIYRYFPAARSRDLNDFLTIEAFSELMTTAGFVEITHQRQYLTPSRSLAEFQTYVSQRFRASQLMMITDDEYLGGLETIARELKDGGPSTATVSDEVALVTISGRKR